MRTTNLNRRCGQLLIFFLMLKSSYALTEESKVENLLLFDLNGDESRLQWYVQNDTVMGGSSQGSFNITDKALIFSGETNTNGGGFSSIRTQRFAKNLSGYSGIKIRIEADGRRYTWSIQTDARWRGRLISYWADFQTTAGEMEEIYIPFTDFRPLFRGFKLDGPNLDLNNISEFALYQYDKTDGAFTLKLFSVEAYTQ
ncbi:MAG: CIA30 family protein [Pseudomonadales bacterium]|nr:CIA30 family protein [Pseudomonadales bacterium]